MTVLKTFHVSIPTDGNGFVGRACNSPDCKQYFKIRASDLKDNLHCPYCGTNFSKNDMLTREQTSHVRAVAIEQARTYVHQEFQKMLANAVRGSKHMTFKPGPTRTTRTILPTYREREVDSEIECSECETRFQVYGIFGHCPGCNCENLLVYDANWAIIKRGIQNADDKKRQLRHAYSDLVSTFESFCNRKAAKLTTEKGNFQVLFDARKFFKQHANVDILTNVSQPSLLSLRRVFQKRHVCIHAGGTVTERYTKMIPEDVHLLGTDVELLEVELEDAATAMRSALGELVRNTERPGK